MNEEEYLSETDDDKFYEYEDSVFCNMEWDGQRLEINVLKSVRFCEGLIFIYDFGILHFT